MKLEIRLIHNDGAAEVRGPGAQKLSQRKLAPRYFKSC